MVGKPFVQNAEEYKLYKTLEDTFNAFDRDGNAELGWKEYLEAWRFLDQPGTDSDVKRAFDAVDINGSGLVEIDEFMFSIMGDKANKYGGLADLERLTGLLGDLTGKYTLLQGGMDEMKEDADSRARRNQLLRDRLENMKKEVGDTVNGLMDQNDGHEPRGPMTDEEINAHLTEVFTKKLRIESNKEDGTTLEDK
eukprot:TRINITY_DN2396_c0_g1_i1.p1 TRINITY_DN2396_c0_g1~~TRINITY_DN2396_c0_g1_i1.p1  ORF type:complete len:195 (-),score=42.39 TRINITY_DN2396_c0_g1_i1:71-655(-)